MPCRITFEVATLADAIAKAARIAPSKGPAFDRAGGLLMEINTGIPEMTVRSTDEVVFFEQRIEAVGAQGSSSIWRIPARLFADVISSLPMTQDSQVELIDRGDEAIRLSCGRIKGRFNRMDPESFPRFQEYHMSTAHTAHDFATKVEQVSWACDLSSDRLSGVFVDGKRLVGCSTNALATIPCIVPVAEPVIVPLSSIATILKQASDLRVEAADRKFHMQLDPETKASSVLIEGQYPNVDHVARKNFASSFEAHKGSMVDVLDRMLNLIRQDRQPRLRVEISNAGMLQELVFDVDVPGIGRMMDSVDIVTDFDGSFEMLMTPANLHKAVSNAKSDKIKIYFGHPDPTKMDKSSIMIEDDSTGYQCWTMPLNPKAKAGKSK